MSSPGSRGRMFWGWFTYRFRFLNTSNTKEGVSMGRNTQDTCGFGLLEWRHRRTSHCASTMAGRVLHLDCAVPRSHARCASRRRTKRSTRNDHCGSLSRRSDTSQSLQTRKQRNSAGSQGQSTRTAGVRAQKFLLEMKTKLARALQESRTSRARSPARGRSFATKRQYLFVWTACR
jgi:hypothetical protein